MDERSWSISLGEYGVLVHGGAGKKHATPRFAGCERAAAEASAILRDGGSSLDAVQRAVTVLEDDPDYNAGTGGVLTEDGGLEHDAALMDGTTLRAGSVASLVGFKN